MNRSTIKRNYKYIVLVLGIILLTGIHAFAQANPEPNERITLGEEGKSIQEDMPIEEYTYIPGERRDPFISLLKGGMEVSEVGDELSPLQRIDVSDLKLVGIVKNPAGNTALIQTPDGKGYFLRKGLQVGKNEGIVDSISEDKVIVKEKKADYLGQIIVSEFVLTLKKEEGNR